MSNTTGAALVLAKASPDDFLGRFREIISDPLNLLIRRVPQAGVVDGDFVYLHNGLKVPISGPYAYYGNFSIVLVANRGVHEPLEEFVFQQLLARLPKDPVMLELGAYWGHYSMWLKALRPEATVVLVEPELHNLQTGMANFELNGLQGEFIQAFVGNDQFQVDRYLKDHGLEELEILHSDIQGYELEMLQSAIKALGEQRIKYCFVSTHSQDLHYKVLELLSTFGYRIEVSSDFDNDTTSYDGLVFASSPSVEAVFDPFTPLKRTEITESSPESLVNYLAQTIRISRTGYY